jgi:hypothetical protein
MAKARQLFICLDNAGYEACLERLKIYVALPDSKGERTGFLGIGDESGEDYLYPRQRFVTGRTPRFDPAGGPTRCLGAAIRCSIRLLPNLLPKAGR